MKNPAHSIALLGSVILVCIALGACAGSTLEYIPNGGVYTITQAEDLASRVSLAEIENVRTSEGPTRREEALLELRETGDEGSLLADALTRDFPSGATSVPLLVESASVDGREVWIVVEAWGDEDGTLSRRRLWVLDRSTFVVLASSSFN